MVSSSSPNAAEKALFAISGGFAGPKAAQGSPTFSKGLIAARAT